MAYSVFIGLTLGGVPVVRRLIRRLSPAVWISIAAGFVAMAAVAWFQSRSAGAGDVASDSFGMMLFAGVAGASAMILPGISGGYLLLVLGVYVTILAAISAFKDALEAGDIAAIMEPAIGVILPVGIGVVVGIVLVSNAIKWLLARYEQPTLGVLMGLLLGAVVGLWPFQEGVRPEVGSTFKGEVVTAERVGEIQPEAFPTRFFDPTATQVVGALGLVIAGFMATLVVARLGREGNQSPADPAGRRRSA
jgi:putative membrane protein